MFRCGKGVIQVTDKEKDSVMEDMHTMILDEFDKSVYIGTSSIIGRRNEQQDAIKSDSFYAYAENGKAISVLCDGMGGLAGGQKASALCSSIVYNTFHSNTKFPSIPVFYKSVICQADEEVKTMKVDGEMQILGAGTTLVSVIIDDDQLYWASVGDSRIYIIRSNEILCITKDHNFLMLLNEKVRRGEITQEEADSNPRREALISYIGIGGIRYVDMNSRGFHLLDGDYIVLCSDGLYRSVSEDEIKKVVCNFGKETQQAAEALTNLALSKNLKNQDNTSVVVIGYQDSG